MEKCKHCGAPVSLVPDGDPHYDPSVEFDRGYAAGFKNGSNDFLGKAKLGVRCGQFIKDLRDIINKHCKENDSNTPDYILADYLEVCLTAFTIAVQQRESWFGRSFPDIGATLVKLDKAADKPEN